MRPSPASPAASSSCGLACPLQKGSRAQVSRTLRPRQHSRSTNCTCAAAQRLLHIPGHRAVQRVAEVRCPVGQVPLGVLRQEGGLLRCNCRHRPVMKGRAPPCSPPRCCAGTLAVLVGCGAVPALAMPTQIIRCGPLRPACSPCQACASLWCPPGSRESACEHAGSLQLSQMSLNAREGFSGDTPCLTPTLVIFDCSHRASDGGALFPCGRR